jgi:histidine triad (HIT) family protein
MSDCLFCKILKAEIPSEKVYENDVVYGFKDIHPLAKEHYLFIHKSHTKNINDLATQAPHQLTDVFTAISDFTRTNNLEEDGFRVVTNVNSNGGQTVFHTHFHVLGGEALKGFGA